MAGMSASRPSALALVSAAAKGVDRRFSAVIEDFAVALDEAHAFAALSFHDAHAITEIIVSALTESDHPANVLREYAEDTALIRDNFVNHSKARRALAAAAKLYAERVYGYRPAVARYRATQLRPWSGT